MNRNRSTVVEALGGQRIHDKKFLSDGSHPYAQGAVSIYPDEVSDRGNFFCLVLAQVVCGNRNLCCAIYQRCFTKTKVLPIFSWYTVKQRKSFIFRRQVDLRQSQAVLVCWPTASTVTCQCGRQG
jgi:hypothetical protein